jgi:Zn-dependent protease with chaperone function
MSAGSILVSMIDLPEWDSQFIARAKRYTRWMNLYSVGRALIVLIVPCGLALTASSGSLSAQWGFRPILLFFAVLSVLLLVDEVLWDPKLRRKRRLVYRSAGTLSELALLCLLTVYWWLVFPGHIALALGAWWVGGIALALIRYVMRMWALREAVLLTKDYKLFGHRTGKFSKRIKHDRASLYALAEDSAFPRDTVMTLSGHQPDIYVGAEARRILDPDELRSAIAHELGHSWSQHYVGYELADWIRRLFFVPMLVSAGSALLARMAPWIDRHMIFAFLAMMTLAWEMNVWASHLLSRPRELAADLYAVEMTRTPQAFATGLVKLFESRPYNVPPNLLDALGLLSHPCVAKRLRCIAAAEEASDARPHREGLRRRPASG